jgi:CubicO group peptidase (beta-lactamase class C family)
MVAQEGMSTRSPWLAVVALAVALPLTGAPACHDGAGLRTALRQDDLAIRAFERAFPAEMARTGIPGLALVIVRGDRVVYERGFGVASVETGDPVRPETLFRLGSTAKVVTGLALSVLADRGELDLKAPIGRYASGLHPAIAALTLDQLLTHTSGLANDAAMEGPTDDGALASRVRGWTESALSATPGTVMAYSNPGYALAGYVLECATKMRFADAVRDLVLNPLGMTRSTYRPLEALTYPVAHAHEASPDGPQLIRPIPENAANYPPGSLFSSARELGRLMIAMLNQGRVDGRQAIAPGAVALLNTRFEPMPGAKNSEYGYGVTRKSWRGFTLLENRGARLGYGSRYMMVPDQRVGVFLLVNRTSAVPDALMEELLARLLKPSPAPPAPAR